MRVERAFRVNGHTVNAFIEQSARLIDVLRGPLGLTGTKEGCGNGECGACTVIVDGRAVNACLFPAMEAADRDIVTVEGLVGAGGELSEVQRAFVEGGAIQCGFCSPGMIMSTAALLGKNPDPNEEEIRTALVGNLCRCTGYSQIIDAVHLAAKRARKPAGSP